MIAARPLLLISCFSCFVGQGCGPGGVDPIPKKTEARTRTKPTPLVDKAAWVAVDAATDPLASHRPTEVSCPRGGWIVEPTGFEISTRLCNYAMFSQPTLTSIEPGDRVVAMVYHFNLLATEPATAHVALAIGERVIWEQEVAIPGKANVHNVDVVADFAAPVGTPVYFHLHNHGFNNWTLASMGVAHGGAAP